MAHSEPFQKPKVSLSPPSSSSAFLSRCGACPQDSRGNFSLDGCNVNHDQVFQQVCVPVEAWIQSNGHGNFASPIDPLSDNTTGFTFINLHRMSDYRCFRQVMFVNELQYVLSHLGVGHPRYMRRSTVIPKVLTMSIKCESSSTLLFLKKARRRAYEGVYWPF
jgi:hypothetical protein